MWFQLKEEYHTEPLHRQIENIYPLYPLPSQHTHSLRPARPASTDAFTEVANHRATCKFGELFFVSETSSNCIIQTRKVTE